MTAPTSFTLSSFPNFFSSYPHLFQLVFFCGFSSQLRLLSEHFQRSLYFVRCQQHLEKKKKEKATWICIRTCIHSTRKVKWSVKTWMDYFTGTCIMISRRKFNFYTYFHFCKRIGRSSTRAPSPPASRPCWSSYSSALATVKLFRK